MNFKWFDRMFIFKDVIFGSSSNTITNHFVACIMQQNG